MGKPKFSRKKYETPSHPWQEDRIKAENEFLKKYGLKNKREVWKAQTRLRKYRGQARELLAKISTGDAQSKKESDQLLMYFSTMNILPPKSTLDDVLALNTESILSRRLQTLTYLKGLANTPDQSRQLISHGHIAIGDRRVTVPGYLVTKDEEGEIGYTSDSPLNDTMHPARPKADFKSIPFKREEKSLEPKEKVKERKTTEKTPIEKPKEKAPSEKPKETAKVEKPELIEKQKQEPSTEQPTSEKIPEPSSDLTKKEEPKEPAKAPKGEPETQSESLVKEETAKPKEEKPVEESKKEEKPKKEKTEESKGGE